MTQLESSTSVGLPLPKRHRWVPTAMVSHLTAQETEAAALDPSVQKLEGHIRTREPSLPCPQAQGGNIPTEMTPLHVNIEDAHWVYHCWVMGCPEGPSSSCATICPHVCHIHLGMKLSYPLCPITFLILMPSNGMAGGHLSLGLRTQLKECYTYVYINKRIVIQNM